MYKCPHDIEAGFLQNKQSKRKQVRSHNVFNELALDIYHHHFLHILFIRVKYSLYSGGGELGFTFGKEVYQIICGCILKPLHYPYC